MFRQSKCTHGIAISLSSAACAGALLFIGGNYSALSGQTPPARPIIIVPNQPKSEKSPKTGKLDVLSGGSYDAKTSVFTGRDFTYHADDMVVTGVNARYNKDKQILDADGNLVMDDPKHHVTGDKAHVDDSPKMKLSIFTGNVVIVLKPKAADGAAKKDDIGQERGQGGIITCDHVEDYYKKEFIILKGHLTFKQKITKDDGKIVERTLTADHAEYDGKKEKLLLFAPVGVKDSENQEAHFEKDVLVGTKEGSETLESKGPGHFIFNIPEEK